MSNKGRQTAVGAVLRASKKRPTGKFLINVTKSAFGTSQVSTTLFTTIYPATITGLRWMFDFNNEIADAAVVRWAIIKLADGLSAPTISGTDGSDFYTPEGDVMAFGVGTARGNDDGVGPAIVKFEGATKTMRKMQPGDLLQVILVAGTAASFTCSGCVQFFAKS